MNHTVISLFLFTQNKWVRQHKSRCGFLTISHCTHNFLFHYSTGNWFSTFFQSSNSLRSRAVIKNYHINDIKPA